MRYNICIIQPPGYVHSLAFTELAELLLYSLAELGHQAMIQFNSLDPEQSNILIGCHLLEPGFLAHIPNSTVILNTEQISSDSSSWHQNIYDCITRFETWDYSVRNIEKIKSLGLPPPKHLNLGYQKELARIPRSKEPWYDVLFYGSVNERRLKILNDLDARGLKTKSVFGVYGAERDELIARSRIVLNLHLYKSEIFEVVRVFYLLTNSIAVVGEVSPTTHIEPMYRQGIVPTLYDDLVTTCEQLVADETRLARIAEEGFFTISRYPQRLFTEQVL